MALDVLEQIDHPARGRSPTLPVLGVQGEILQAFLLHSLPERSFHQGLNKQREEVHAEHALDPVHRLEEHRRQLIIRLELREPLLDPSLPLVRLQKLLS